MENMYAKVAEVELSYRPVRCVRPRVSDATTAASIFRNNWNEGQIEFRESVKIMLVNKRCSCMGICTIADGGGACCSVDTRHILQSALIGNAAYIILCHNHPSGNLTPSQDDNNLTTKVRKGCEAVGIKLFDHIILSPDEDEYYSYQENGKL